MKKLPHKSSEFILKLILIKVAVVIVIGGTLIYFLVR